MMSQSTFRYYHHGDQMVTWVRRLRLSETVRHRQGRRTAVTWRHLRTTELWAGLWSQVGGLACSEWVWSEPSGPWDLLVSNAVRDKCLCNAGHHSKKRRSVKKAQTRAAASVTEDKLRLELSHLLFLLGVWQLVSEQWRVSIRRVRQNTELLLQHGLLGSSCTWICESCRRNMEKQFKATPPVQGEVKYSTITDGVRRNQSKTYLWFDWSPREIFNFGLFYWSEFKLPPAGWAERRRNSSHITEIEQLHRCKVCSLGGAKEGQRYNYILSDMKAKFVPDAAEKKCLEEQR